MSLEQAYNEWSEQYDSNVNKTRDLEKVALRSWLRNRTFKSCLEIGCGTGKNTLWLASIAERITAVDLSPEMLGKARQKLSSPYVEFIQADIRESWGFVKGRYDLIVFSLVLEHVSNLQHVFKESSRVLAEGGYLYLGELHPFRQYAGAGARYEKDGVTHAVEAYTHHVSDYVRTAQENHLVLEDLQEWFDQDDPSSTPRILSCLFRNSSDKKK